MKNNKKTVTAPKVRAFGEAKQIALAGVRKAAFASGVSRNAVVQATAAALGKKPVLALYNAGKLELQIGFMAAALARKGDNRPGDVLMAHCRERIMNYAGATGTGKLKADQKGRRTKDEEAAYGSARVQVSGIMKDAGVIVPEPRGGDTSSTRQPRPAVKATGKAAAKAANDAKPAVHRFKDKAALLSYLTLQGAAMLATLNRSATAAPIEAKSAVQDFVARIKAIA